MNRCLVEQFINGIELTVGLARRASRSRRSASSLPRIFRLRKQSAKSSDTEHRFEPGIPPEVAAKVRELARKANNVVGARDLARIDVMLDERLNPYLLEINTLPGFTPKSLLPEAANHAGIAFGTLVDRLVKRAGARHPAAA